MSVECRTDATGCSWTIFRLDFCSADQPVCSISGIIITEDPCVFQTDSVDNMVSPFSGKPMSLPSGSKHFLICTPGFRQFHENQTIRRCIGNKAVVRAFINFLTQCFCFATKRGAVPFRIRLMIFRGMMYFCQPAGGTDTKLIHVMEWYKTATFWKGIPVTAVQATIEKIVIRFRW